MRFWPATWVALTLACLSVAARSYDVLELPAVPSALAPQAVVYGVRNFSGTLYATGQRGHILVSEDGGASWEQASVPVRSDLLDIYFLTPKLGWAVGHDGAILHSSDGGRSWALQFDGFRLSEEGLAWYERKAAEDPNEPFYDVLVGEMEFGLEQGADKPFFRVWFENPQRGYAIGAYGVMVETLDGGESWHPVLERLMYDQFIHLYDFAPAEDGLVIVGEMGYMLQWDDSTGRYEVLQSPYNGSFFTALSPAPGQLLVAGLRGKAFFRSAPEEQWQPVIKPESGSVVDTILLSDGRVLLASSDGKLMVSNDPAAGFQELEYEYPALLSAVTEGAPGQLIIAGSAGLQSVELATLTTRQAEN